MKTTIEIEWTDGSVEPENDCNLLGYKEDGSFFSAFYMKEWDSFVEDNKSESVPWEMAKVDCYCIIDSIFTSHIDYLRETGKFNKEEDNEDTDEEEV